MITLHDFMCDPKLAGRVFAAPSWNGWKAIACLLDGHTRLLDDGGKALVRELLGRDTLPTEVPDECFLIAPRRCGKTNFCAAVMAHGATIDHRARLQRGEWATLESFAPTISQAEILWQRTRGIIAECPMLERAVVRETSSTLEFKHRTRIEVGAASFRTARGPTRALVVLDEACFIRDESGALSDRALAAALRPSLLTLGGRLIAISSPYMRSGLMYDMHEKYHGEAHADA